MKKIFPLFIILMGISALLNAQPGTLDNSFAVNGKAIIPVGIANKDYANAVAIQSDGKIIVAGYVHTGEPGNHFDFAVIRLNTNGTLDTEFDGDGKVIINTGTHFNNCYALVIQPDGKILLAGYYSSDTDWDFLIIRLNANGSLDNSFDGDGKAIIPFEEFTDDAAFAMALMGDGRIVVAGESDNGFLSVLNGFLVVRLLSNGTPDPSFGGGDGERLINFSFGNDTYAFAQAYSVAVQTDGKIVVAGRKNSLSTFSSNKDAVVVRLDEGGNNDITFADNGILIFPSPPDYNAAFRSVVIQPDNKILLAGVLGAEGITTGFRIRRLNSNGSPDINFGTNGEAHILLADPGYGEPYAMTLQPDGKILVAGRTLPFNNSTISFSIIRLNSNGSLDNCFDGDGKLILTSANQENATCIALQSDGKIILGGYGGVFPVSNFIVYRLIGGGGTGQDLDADGYNSCVDCDDNNPAINPGATEICNSIDDDCDGLIDEGCSPDNDGDGYTIAQGDCNDNNPAINPGATEICNTVDDDCDGLIDEGVQITFYRDFDTDGYGNPSVTVQVCTAPAGYVSNSTDCNDNDPAINPSATEVCNTVDDDCDGLIDEGVQTTFYRDFDTDGFGNLSFPTQACIAPAGYVSNSTDCNDNNAAINPSATEICNGEDDDCDGLIDEGGQITFYRDFDIDGYGNLFNTIQACIAPAGYVTNSLDCNDNNVAINPGALEICNGVDDDCDGLIDEGGVQITFYRDFDTDGFGNLSITTQACIAPTGYVINSTDCNDNNAAINPAAAEICNGADDDCDGLIDEGCNPDNDGDGFTVAQGDCNDNDSAIHPDATEVCNGIDDDCDGLLDDADPSVTFRPTWYADADGDGYGNNFVTTLACNKPVGYVSDNTDCDDTPISGTAINPGAMEVCNGIDDDCDGLTDDTDPSVTGQPTWYADADGDGYGNNFVSTLACNKPLGYVSDNTDCNDTPVSGAAINPGAIEICNNIDDNCNGQIDEAVLLTFYLDFDADGYGNAAITTQACVAPEGYVSNNTDCNDNNPAIYPGATEICNNGADDNCNGVIDENTVVATIIPGGTISLCNGSSLLLSANTGAGLSYQWFRNNTALAGETGTTLVINAAGDYSVAVTNSGNCTITSVATVVNNANPPKAGISMQGNKNKCPVNLNAHPGGPGITYQWNKNDVALPGATTQSYSATTSGSYTVTVTKDGCSSTSSPVIVASCPLNLLSEYTKTNPVTGNWETIPVQNGFKIYPNPASENITVEISPGNGINGEAIIQITTVSGSILLTQKALLIKGKLLQHIRLNNKWNDNIYIVKIITRKQVFTARLVIMKL